MTVANTDFTVPELVSAGAWVDYRGNFDGGYGWRYDKALSARTKVAIHHSVTTPSGNALTDVSTIDNIHASNGWDGIGYHIVVTSEEIVHDGVRYAVVAYVGDLLNVRACSPNLKGAFGIPAGEGNEQIICINIVGRFDGGRPMPSEAQLRSAKLVAQELIFDEDGRLPNLANNWTSLIGHQETDPTACPGDWDTMKPLIVNTVTGVSGATSASTVTVWEDLAAQDKGKYLVRDNGTNLYDVSGTPPIATRQYVADHEINNIEQHRWVNGVRYVRTSYSKSRNIDSGFKFNDLYRTNAQLAQCQAQLLIANGTVASLQQELSEWVTWYNNAP